MATDDEFHHQLSFVNTVDIIRSEIIYHYQKYSSVMSIQKSNGCSKLYSHISRLDYKLVTLEDFEVNSQNMKITTIKEFSLVKVCNKC